MMLQKQRIFTTKREKCLEEALLEK